MIYIALDIRSQARCGAIAPHFILLQRFAHNRLNIAAMGAIDRRKRGRLILPDRQIAGSGPVAIVGNGRQTGGNVQVAPRARIDDGLLDVLVVRHIPPMALLTAARELQELSPDGEYISYWQTPWAEVYPEESIPVNLDGEPVQLSSVRYEAVPRAIRLIVPLNCPLLSATAK